VNPTTIVLVQEKNEADANHRPLAENWERVPDFRLENGARPEVIALPMPAPVIFDGQRLPASYANFYICNAAVLVPTFNDPRPDRAGHSGRTDHGPPRHRHPRAGSGLGPGHHPLPDQGTASSIIHHLGPAFGKGLG
jgi:hypothetical protein